MEEVVDGRRPHFDYAIIVCAMRFVPCHISYYYAVVSHTNSV